ncbi:MAG: DEAD/DEAH box helicase [Acidobacteria bacterium]|nr:DEAD/DEAH box helicase [Acidobacteriota bacterium]
MTLPDTIPAALAGALSARGYTTLTQVQAAVLASHLAGKDLLVSAQTGSGKTVAFGLAMADDLLAGEDTLMPASSPLAIIVAPTRELAMQVARELGWLYGNAGARLATCVGGMDMRDERRALERGAHIVIGTPGRLGDHIKRGSLVTGGVRVVVLDEADEMLDMGFREELELILQDTPDERRTLMFSATVPKGIAALAARYQKNAERVTTDAEKSQHVDIEYKAMLVAPGDEENAIVNIVRHSDSESALVFCSTRAAVNKLMSRMGNRGFPVVALSGELSQKERSNALQALRDGRARVCIATDVAARGLDLKNLGLVIHADLPRDPATLLHRSGRTGRAGRKGVSAMLVAPKARRRVERLLQDAKISASWGKPPSADEIARQDDARLLADPALSDPANDNEAALVEQLLAQHGAAAVAAAFIRAKREGRSAPEDLREVDDRASDRRERAPRADWDRPERGERPERAPRPDREDRPPREKRPRTERADIPGAVWIAINVGRKKNADPKWLLPMLCKAGGLERDDIGQIRINSGNTHVELTQAGAERLFTKTGESGRLEGSLQAFPLPGIPEPEPFSSDAPPRRERREEAPRAPYRKERPARADRPPRERGHDETPPPRAFAPSDYVEDDRSKGGKPGKPYPKTGGGKGGFKGKPAHAKGPKPAYKAGPKSGKKPGGKPVKYKPAGGPG